MTPDAPRVDTRGATPAPSEPIRTFQGKHAFLSNFHTEADGLTLEHRFQAAKTDDPTERDWVLAAPKPGSAKARGKKVTLRSDWNEKRVDVMRELLREKFKDPDLRAKLDATGDAELQEGNIWNDTFWGVSLKTGKGKNNLGKLLMEIREENRRATSGDTRRVGVVESGGTAAPSTTEAKMARQMPKQFYRDADWIETFPVGSPWVTGAFRPNRERELVEAGVLVPVEGKPGEFTVGRRTPVDAPAPAPAPPSPARKAKVVATPEVVEAKIEFDTREEAEQLVAQMPKSLRLKVNTYSGGWTQVHMRAELWANEANGGVNETGIKRYQTFLRAAEKAGVEIDHQMPYGNSISADELAAQIKRGGSAMVTSVDDLPDHAIIELHKATLSHDERVTAVGSTYDSLRRLGLIDERGKLTEDGAILQAERIGKINLRNIEGAVKGDMVTHKKLGDGLILNISPVGEVQVRFRDGSQQWVDGRDLSDLQRRADSVKPVEQLKLERDAHRWLGTVGVIYEKDIARRFGISIKEAGELMMELLKKSDVNEVRGGIVRDV